LIHPKKGGRGMQGSDEVDNLLHSLKEIEARLRDLVGSDQAEAILIREMEVFASRDQFYRLSIEKLAHDLSNVLAPVQMSAFLLRLHVEGGEGEEILLAMEQSVTHGMDLVRQTLALARVEGRG
jgi:signal transduction histidine kinase